MIQQQWKAFTLDLHSDRAYENPFLNVDVTAVFTGPEGEILRVLGFWDGGGTWRIRAALTAVGQWRYSTCASDGNPDFSSEGSICCVAYDGELDIYRHGFLRKGPQGRYLVYDDGTPFFWLGDTHWTFVTEERWDESNCPKYESQFKACVDRRVAQKFTIYESNLRDGPEDFRMFGRYDQYLIETEHGYLPNIDFLQRNPDLKMQYIADAGLVNAVGFSWNNAITASGREHFVLLAKYLVARYGAYPVIWTLGGELPGYFSNDFDQLIDDWRQVALETEKWDPYNHLTTFHQASARPFLDLYIGENWYDFALTQGAHGDFDFYPTMYSEWVQKHPGYPIVEGESLYEGATSNEHFSRVITPDMVRYVAWLCMQTGGCGYTYGCNGVWELQWEAGVGGIGWGDMAWWDGLELPAAGQLTLMREFYEKAGWWELKPIGGLIEGGRMGRKMGLFTANDQMTTVVGYFGPWEFASATIKGLSCKSYTAQWFNPETGVYTLIDADARPHNGVWRTPMEEQGMWTHEKHDKVLLLTANAAKKAKHEPI